MEENRFFIPSFEKLEYYANTFGLQLILIKDILFWKSHNIILTLNQAQYKISTSQLLYISGKRTLN